MSNRNIIFVLGIFAMLFFGCTSTPQGPSPPTGVNVKATASGTIVSWTPSASADVSGYNIYRSNAAGQLGGKINGGLVNDVTFADNTAQNGNTYYYTVRAVDSKGTEEKNIVQVALTVQNAPPSGLMIKINNGAAAATTKTVSLTLAATGASQCRLSNDGNNWSEWNAYTSQMSWNLDGSDGTKTVSYECRNAVGVVSPVATSTIYLKTIGASVQVLSPAEGDTTPLRFNVTFRVINTFGPVACNGVVDDVNVLIGSVTDGQVKTIPVTLLEGSHSGYIQCSDQISNFTSATIHVQTEANPISLTIDNGQSATASTSVTLNIYAPAAAQCRYSNNGASYSNWEAYQSNKAWTLTSGNGQKMVYVQCQTAAGTSLGTATDKISLQSVPTVLLSINNDDAVTTSMTVRLTVGAPTAVDCRFGDTPHAGTWQPYQQTLYYILPNGDGMKTVYCDCRDAMGVVGSTYSSIRLKQTPQDPPSSLSIEINGGASRTSSKDVTLTLNAYNAKQCRYKNELPGASWSGWSSFTRSRTWTLADGTGSKIVYYQCSNDYGTSDVVSASIIYGTSQPTIDVSSPIGGNVYEDSTVSIVFTPRGSSSLNCVYYCNGISRSVGSVSSGSQVSRTLLYEGMDMRTECGVPSSGSRFTTQVVCTDQDGNQADTGAINFQWSRWVGPLTG